MDRELTVSSRLIGFRADRPLSAGMHAIVLRLGDEIDQARLRADVREAMWFTLPARELRTGRSDNFWLRQLLDALTGVKVGGDYRADQWGAVLIAEWHIEAGGSMVRVLVPPAAINALRDPEFWSHVEQECLLRLRGAARTLYLAIADRKWMRERVWEVDVDELRELLGAADNRSYARFNRLRERVIDPAVERINRYGPVTVQMKPRRVGRVVTAVRFEWEFKSLDAAREAAAEADRPAVAQGKPRDDGGRDAPPLMGGSGVATLPAPVDPRPREERAPVPEVAEFLASRS